MSGQIVRVTLVYDHGVSFGSRMTTGFNARFEAAGDPSDSELQDLATIVADWWDAGVLSGDPGKGFFGTHVQLAQVEAQVIEPTEGIGQVVLSGVAGTITETGNELSLSDAVLVSLRTAQSGRSRRGRMYFPQPTQTAMAANGILDATYGADLRASVADMFNRVASEGTPSIWTPVVWSPTLAAATVITNVLVAREVADQRRRELRNQGYFTAA